MYFIMTTLGTIGYGDYVPQSSAEKLLNVILQIICAFVFSTLIYYLTLAFNDTEATNGEYFKLKRWFSIIKRIRM